MPSNLQLPVSALKFTIDTNALKIPEKPPQQTTIIGQTRARSAFVFGIAMTLPGYNIYVMGNPGSGRLSMVTDYLSDHAHRQAGPFSYAYVENFANPREPVAICLPAGYGHRFCKDIETLIDNVLAMFPAAFENPAYQQKKTAIERRFNQRYHHAIDQVDEKARAWQVALYRDSESISFLPVRDNKTLDEEQFALLPQPEREAFHQHTEELEDYMAEVLTELPTWRRTMTDKIKQLNDETIGQAVGPFFAELNKAYQDIDDVVTYLAELEKNLRGTIIDALMPEGSHEHTDTRSGRRMMLIEHYLPNILVDGKMDNGAPVIYEPHPTYQNLFGRIEYVNERGTLVTNYRRICAGSLHRANGGYLILDAEKLLTYAFVWEGLKRALKTGRIEIDSPYADLGIHAMSLKPEVIPLNVKVILVGPRDSYYLLEELDAEFNEMFRVLADFDDHIQRTEQHIDQFAVLLCRQARDVGARPLTRAAIVRLIEHSCRMAESQSRLSAHINETLEIIAEANQLSGNSEKQEIDVEQVELALSAREARNGRIAQEILEEILEGIILIDTQGDAVGKVNGLTVIEVGDSSFGAPVRISATVYPGTRGIVDIEREVELGQSIHSKGVMILTGFLGHCYAQDFHLAISASIAIEQSYGYIDGDSASLAELCCLISALTHIPIKQDFAITGSINQYGEVQAIGGVNEKIEGFFRLCQARGLTGRQGVIIPASNKTSLMLNREVINAVEHGLFAVYGVSTVNQTLELVIGQAAGEMDRNGRYPKDSINSRVVARLRKISELSSDVEKEQSSSEWKPFTRL